MSYTNLSIQQNTRLAAMGWPRFQVAELTELWNQAAEEARTTGPWGASEALRLQAIRAAEAWAEFYDSWNPRGESLTPAEIEEWQRATRRLAIALDTMRRTPTSGELWDQALEETLAERAEDIQSIGRAVHAAAPSFGKMALGAAILGGGIFVISRLRR